jgi:hypothetical protein
MAQGYFTGESAVMMRTCGLVQMDCRINSHNYKKEVLNISCSSYLNSNNNASSKRKTDPSGSKTKSNKKVRFEETSEDLLADLENDSDEDISDANTTSNDVHETDVQTDTRSIAMKGEWKRSDDIDFGDNTLATTSSRTVDSSSFSATDTFTFSSNVSGNLEQDGNVDEDLIRFDEGDEEELRNSENIGRKRKVRFQLKSISTNDNNGNGSDSDGD